MVFPATEGIYHSYISFCLSPLLPSCIKFEDKFAQKEVIGTSGMQKPHRRLYSNILNFTWVLYRVFRDELWDWHLGNKI